MHSCQNEPSKFHKDEIFLDYAREYQLLKDS